MSDHIRLHAIARGRVQGVNFRASAQREAGRLKLTGWTQNQWDGSVETVAEGTRGALKEFEGFLRRGPSAARVDHIDVAYEAATGEFSGFNIRY